MEDTELQEIEIEKIEKGLIVWNYDRMKAVLGEYASRYENIVVTEESLKGCQLIQKELAGMRRALDEKRKEVKRELEKPVSDFNQKANDLIAIIATVEDPIKAGIAVFEDRRKEERTKFILETFDNNLPSSMPEKFRSIDIVPAWLNKTTSDNELVGIIVGIIQGKTKEWEREASDIALIASFCETASEGLKNKLDPKVYLDRYGFGILPATLVTEISTEAAKRKFAENEIRTETVEQERVKETAKEPVYAPVSIGIKPKQETKAVTVSLDISLNDFSDLKAWLNARGIMYSVKV